MFTSFILYIYENERKKKYPIVYGQEFRVSSFEDYDKGDIEIHGKGLSQGSRNDERFRHQV